MKVLLDTHIWLWSLREPHRLGKETQRILADPSHELWLSPISIWEALILLRKGRISINDAVEEWVDETTAWFREAPLTWEVAKISEAIGLVHSDPADRFLAASAKVFGLTLLTADKNLLGLADIATLANR